MITDRRKFTSKWSLYGMSSFHFTVIIISTCFTGCTFRTRKIPAEIFVNVRRLILILYCYSTDLVLSITYENDGVLRVAQLGGNYRLLLK